MRVVVATRPVDFRKGHDGLAAVVEHELSLDPYSGVTVVFRSKRMDRVKVLWWDGFGAGVEASRAGPLCLRIDADVANSALSNRMRLASKRGDFERSNDGGAVLA